MSFADLAAKLLNEHEAENEQSILNASPASIETSGVSSQFHAVIHEVFPGNFETRLEIHLNP